MDNFEELLKKRVKEELSNMPLVCLNKTKISDIVIAATLIYLGYRLHDIEKITKSPRSFYCIIDIAEDKLQEELNKISNNKILVEPKRFYEAIRYIKNRIFLLKKSTTKRYLGENDFI